MITMKIFCGALTQILKKKKLYIYHFLIVQPDIHFCFTFCYVGIKKRKEIMINREITKKRRNNVLYI